MQNPRKGLKKNKWYRVASDIILHATSSAYSKKLTMIPQNSMVMFLRYGPQSVRTCMVMYGEYFGWVMVEKRDYKEHTHFFREVREDG